MINDDILIKLVRNRGFRKTWPEQVCRMNSRIDWIKQGFPGIGNDHLSIDYFKNIKIGDIFIYDQYLEIGFGYGDEAPLMLKVLDSGKYLIEGIGKGADSIRDPYRINLRWKDIIEIPQKIEEQELILKVNPIPSLSGGSAYYYFFKSYRDFRD